MTPTNVSFLDFTPTSQVEELFKLRVNQFLEFVPAQSTVRVLVKKVSNGLEFQAYLVMNTGWGDFKVTVNDSTPETLLEKLGAKLKGLVSLKRKSFSHGITQAA